MTGVMMKSVLMTATMIAGSPTMIIMIAVIMVMTEEGIMKGITTAGSMRVFSSGLDNVPVLNK